MRRVPNALLAFFERLAALLITPNAALRRAARGEWNAFRDALVLVGVASAAVYTPDLVRIVLAGVDLGIREGLQEVSFSLGRRLAPDLLVGLAAAVLVALPLRLAGALNTDRALAVAAGVWMPFFVLRLFGATVRFHAALAPARLWEGPEWWLGAAWGAVLAATALAQGLRGRYA